MSHDQLTSNNNVQTEEQDLDEVFDSDEPRPWFPTGDLKNLPTEIYSDCTLSKAETMSKQQKEFDKIIRNISYRTSAVLHPIDNIEKALSESKPDDNDLEAKTGYDLDLALKAISPAHTTTRDKKGVFGDKLMDLVEEKNARSKLYNDVNKEKLTHEDKTMDVIALTNQANPDRIGKHPIGQPTWRSSMITSPIPGQLKHFKATWLRKFRNSWPASIVATGYSPEWNIKPQLKISTIKKDTLNHSNMDTVKKEIQNLVTIQAIQQISAHLPCFNSNILVIDKKDGKKHTLSFTFLCILLQENTSLSTFWDNIFVSISPVRLDILSQDIHKNSETCDQGTKIKRNTYCCISRRLVNNGKRETNLGKKSQNSIESSYRIGVRNKRTKKSNNTYPIYRILGIQNKLKRHDYPSPKEKDRPNEMRLQHISEEASHSRQKISVDNRETVGNSQCSVPSEVEITRINKIKEQSAKSRWLEHISSTINKSFGTIKMVVKPFREVERSVTSPRYSISHNIYRCITTRMGHQQRKYVNKWSVEQQ
ncbi:hypothetical protein C2G38_2178098 [Gigaspora rosea]|uniref:Uncharacterized protein n=1 Tax=Gigaspora rosea TaxID=44941 RepID=A0A397VEJ5_9GLOM|nr:hypothetical protein C2G38_2178098 [Gigaspora rosea]